MAFGSAPISLCGKVTPTCTLNLLSEILQGYTHKGALHPARVTSMRTNGLRDGLEDRERLLGGPSCDHPQAGESPRGGAQRTGEEGRLENVQDQRSRPQEGYPLCPSLRRGTTKEGILPCRPARYAQALVFRERIRDHPRSR